MSEHTGMMIALHLTAQDAAPLLIDGGEDAASMHATLAYLKGDDNPGLTREAVESVVRDVLAASDVEQLVGTLGGVGRFSASDTSDGMDVVYASLDAPGLSAIRTDIVRALGAAGHQVAADHDFTPHVTLAYIPTDDATPLSRLDPVPVSFSGLSVTIGEETGEEIPFASAEKSIKARVRRAGVRARVRRAGIRARVKKVSRSVGSMCRRGVPVRLKAVTLDRKTRRVDGFIATVRDPFSPDRDGEVFDAKGFLSTIDRFNSGEVIPKIWDDHGRSVGVWTHLEMRRDGDTYGLWGSGLIDEGDEGDAVLIKYESGSYDSLSPGFFPLAGYLHPTARTLQGDPVAVITDIDMFEASLTGTPIDPAARVTGVKAVHMNAVLKSICGGARRKGVDLAGVINTKLDVLLAEDETLTRDDILQVIADQAGVDVEEVSAIARGEVDAPQAETLQAVAEVLNLNLATLIDASEDDVEDTEDAAEDAAEAEGGMAQDEDDAVEKAVDVETVDSDRVSMKVAEELRGIAADMEGLSSRLRRLADEADDTEVVEIVDAERVSVDASEDQVKSINADHYARLLRDATLDLARLELLDIKIN